MQGLSELPDPLRLRMRRTLSWIDRAKKEVYDDDVAFICYWIAFNAAYGREPESPLDSTAQSQFRDYIRRILAIDSDHKIYKAIWGEFSDSIRVLLDNQYVYGPFWTNRAGRGAADWEQRLEEDNRRAYKALGNLDNRTEHNTRRILTTVFDRLYVLRNQCMHGSATWQGSINRDQVRSGAKIMGTLIPLFAELMMSKPNVDWGQPEYPIVS